MRRRFRLILVVLGLAAGCLLCELLLRFDAIGFVASAGEERGFFCRFDSTLGWAPRPNVTADHQRDGFSVEVHQNQFGLRGPDTYAKARHGSNRRVLVLGDSYVWGYGVEQDEVFTAHEVHGTTAEVLNFGVSGYGTDQAYLFYLRSGVGFEVDEVLLVVTPYNDVANNLALEQYGYPKPSYAGSEADLVLRTEHIVERRDSSGRFSSQSRFLNLLARAVREFDNWTRRRNGVTAPGKHHLDASMVSANDRQGVQLTGRIIAALRDEVNRQGVAFCVAFVPYKRHITSGVEHNHPLVPILAAELGARGIDYLDPYSLFLDAQNRGRELFNRFDEHFSKSGHALFGRAVLDERLREATRNVYASRP